MNPTISTTRRARERGQVRERILDAARELFAAEGYDAVTMRRLAERIEYTPPVIYQHFADKAALIREICRQDFRSLAGAFQKLAKIADPIERLRRTGEAYVEFALTHPNHYRLMFLTPDPPGVEVHDHEMDPEAHGNPELDAYAFLRATVDDAWQAGRFNARLADAALIAHVLWQGLHGIVAMHIVRGGTDNWIEYREPRATARLHMESTLHGLTCDVR
jgi:AcrR family transcriptional regulator